MKKILSICISIIVSVCLLPLSAFAEMITITVPGKTIFEQSFVGPLTEVPSGWTLSGTLGTTYNFGEKGIKAINWKGFTIYNNEKIDIGEADYTFSVKLAHNSGKSYLHFGAQTTADAIYDGIASTGYTMKIESQNNNTGVYTIYKNGVEIGTLTDTNTTHGFQSNRTYTFKVTSESITVTGAGDTFTVADTEPITTGYVGMKLRDNNGNKGNLASMSFKTEGYSYEIEKPAEVITGAYVTYATDTVRSNFLMDKTFSAVDTEISLKADSYSISGASAYVTGKGIVKSAAGKLSAHYTGAEFSGAYTLEVVAAKTMNMGTVYFNRANSSNYYSVSTKSGSSNAGTLWIQKTVGGVASSLLSDDDGAVVESLSTGMGTNDELKYIISLQPLDSGDMQITVTLTNYANKVKTYTVTDKKTETNTPFTSGKIGYENSWSGADNNRIESFRVYPTPAEGAEVAKYGGAFQIDGAEVKELSKGNTFFTFPVAMIGQTPDFIAALYEDNEMTDVKMFDVYDMNEGIINLFDTSDSTADDISISLFVWNELEGLVSLLDTYVLQ